MVQSSNKELKQPEGKQGSLIRLNKWISHAGICSRRQADSLIQSGKISVNGQVVTTLGFQVKSTDTVTFYNNILKPDRKVYLLFNKPKNCLTTLYDPEGRKTITDFFKGACPERLYPVGRLDRNTTGLLLLTNDGALAQKLAHPSYEVKKIYQVELATPLTEKHLASIKSGIKLKDGIAQVDQVVILPGDGSHVGIQLHTGKNRIIRRLFDYLGYQIITLDRTLYANLTKKDLPRGKWRFLSQKEINHLKYII
jgi:23S rRNA pseudouridine2605 synthase